MSGLPHPLPLVEEALRSATNGTGGVTVHQVRARIRGLPAPALDRLDVRAALDRLVRGHRAEVVPVQVGHQRRYRPVP